MRVEQNNLRQINCKIAFPALMVQVRPQTAVLIIACEVIFFPDSVVSFYRFPSPYITLQTKTAKVGFGDECLDRLARWIDLCGFLCDTSTVTG